MSDKPERKSKFSDYGDFTKEEVKALIEEYTESVKRGSTGWGVSFKDWLLLLGIAEHVGFHNLKRL